MLNVTTYTTGSPVAGTVNEHYTKIVYMDFTSAGQKLEHRAHNLQVVSLLFRCLTLCLSCFACLSVYPCVCVCVCVCVCACVRACVCVRVWVFLLYQYEYDNVDMWWLVARKLTKSNTAIIIIAPK